MVSVLTWISIYLFSLPGPAESVRIYYETMNAGNFSEHVGGKLYSHTPLGLSYFPRELRIVPKTYVLNFPCCTNPMMLKGYLRWAHTIGNVVFDSKHTKGGHFAAHEVPEALVGDLRKMFGRGGPAFGVVKGKDGY